MHRFGRRKGGLKGSCKDCDAARMREYNRANSERVRETARVRYKADPTKAKACAKDYYTKNIEKCKSDRKKWAEDNSERRKATDKAYRERFPELREVWLKDWLARHPGRAKTYRVKSRNPDRCVAWADKFSIDAFYAEAKRLSEETGSLYVVDHIYPLRGKTVSGLHTRNNLCIVRVDVNNHKHNLLPGFLAHELWEPAGKGVYTGEYPACTTL